MGKGKGGEEEGDAKLGTVRGLDRSTTRRCTFHAISPARTARTAARKAPQKSPGHFPGPRKLFASGGGALRAACEAHWPHCTARCGVQADSFIYYLFIFSRQNGGAGSTEIRVGDRSPPGEVAESRVPERLLADRFRWSRARSNDPSETQSPVTDKVEPF